MNLIKQKKLTPSPVLVRVEIIGDDIMRKAISLIELGWDNLFGKTTTKTTQQTNTNSLFNKTLGFCVPTPTITWLR